MTPATRTPELLVGKTRAQLRQSTFRLLMHSEAAPRTDFRKLHSTRLRKAVPSLGTFSLDNDQRSIEYFK